MRAIGDQRSILRRSGVIVAVMATTLLAATPVASAHPLGNATVNHYDGLALYPDRVVDSAVEDIAEIPNLQRQPRIDTDDDGVLSPTERAVYAASQCRSRAAATKLAVAGQSVTLTVADSSFTERPGAIHLSIGRLACRLTGPVDLSHRTTVSLDSQWDSSGIGWHEITALGHGVSLQNSPFPATSISAALLHYPNDMLSSPLDVRSGTMTTSPGAGTSTYAAGDRPATAGFAVRALNRLSTTFDRLVGARHLTVGVGLLAVALSMLLGAGHAFLPGHGKTIMAAYLVGRRGRLRDVVVVGATVTVTHTAGVLVLGLLISVTSAFAPTAAEQDLAVVSGLIVTGVGVGLLLSALRRRRCKFHDVNDHAHGHTHEATSGTGAHLATAFQASETASEIASVTSAELSSEIFSAPAGASAGHAAGAGTTVLIGHSHPHLDRYSGHGDHDHALVHPHGHPHEHPHSHPHGHSHPPRSHDAIGRPDVGSGRSGHAHGPDHPHSHEPAGFSRGGLLGLGVAGGLVPSPSALLVLLAAIALGRTVFGVALVLAYGLGMAGALTGAGLLLVQFRNRLARAAVGRRLMLANRLIRFLPYLTALLVCIVGIGLTVRALHGIV